jgi:hypothetical protein
MRFCRAIGKFLRGIKRFLVRMLTGPNGGISSKRVNGTMLIQAAIVLGFFIAFSKTRPAAVEVLKLFLYTGAAILGVGNLMENIKIGAPRGPVINNADPKSDNHGGGGKANGPSL